MWYIGRYESMDGMFASLILVFMQLVNKSRLSGNHLNADLHKKYSS